MFLLWLSWPFPPNAGEPKIVSPSPFQLVCQPENPCKVIGTPPPRVILVQHSPNPNKYLCIATNTIINNFGEDSPKHDTVDFFCKHI